MNRPFLWWLPFGGVSEVTPQQLHHWLEDGRPIQLVDSRTRMEYQQGTIGDAPSAPVSELPAALDGLDLDPQKAVVFLCLSGHRSRPGTRLLRTRGYEAYSLKGGIIAWKKAGYPLEKPD